MLLLCLSPVYGQLNTSVSADSLAAGEPVEKINYFQRFFVDGGPITWFLLMPLSVVTVALAVDGVIRLRKTVFYNDATSGQLAAQVASVPATSDGASAQRAAPDDTVLSEVVYSALDDRHHGYLAMEQAMQQTAEQRTTGLLRRIEYLHIIGNVAPMIGLFGTVYGMIRAFNQLVVLARTGAGNQPDRLAEGISIALVTTLWGLLVAIPALSLFSVFRNRIDALIAEVLVKAEHILQPLADADSDHSDGRTRQ